ncbi:MAG: succinylglutamate desuccinylase/aspartoacylase family protein [Bacteroidota bacterium]
MEALLDRIIGRYTGPHRGPLIVAFGGLHGNELAGVRAIDMLFHMLNVEPNHNPTFAFRGRLIGLRGNLQACSLGVRFLEKDLNRQFTPDNISRIRNTATGDLRAEDRELKELLDIVDKEIADYQPDRLIVIDLHTTTADGGIFSIATDDPESIEIAKSMHAPVITGMLKGIRGTTLHHFCCDHFPCPTVSVTFEAGQHEDPLSTRRALAALINLLRSVESVRPEDVENRHDDLLINYSKGLPKVAEMLKVHPVTPEDHFKMIPGFKNFQPIKAGDLLAQDRNGNIFSPFDSHILMPLYQEQGEDGFFLIKVIE